MPSVTLLNMSVLTHAKPNAAALNIVFRSKRAGAADNLHLTVGVTTSMQAATLAAFRQIGLAIDFDKGDGVSSRLSDGEIGSSVQIRSSLDGYGRTMTFSRAGVAQSPLTSALARGRRRVKVTGYQGVPGSVASRPVFDGYTLAARFNASPPAVEYECQDSSVKFASQLLAYNLAPGSNRTRKDVLIEILNLYGMPYGLLDLGPNDGGVVFKGITVGGDQLLLDWIRDFLTPTGRRIKFYNDLFNVIAVDGSAPSQRTYDASQVANLVVTPPANSEPTRVAMSSTVFGYIGQTGRRVEVKIDAITDIYAPASAVKWQDHTTGAIAAYAGAVDAATREIARTVTTTEYDGGTVVNKTVEEWGWYAPRACNKKQDAGGAIGYNDSFDVFLFADGTWRSIGVEQYQIVRTTTTRRFFGTEFLTYEVTDAIAFRPWRLPLGTLDSATGAEVPSVVLVTDAGEAWEAGVESYAAAHMSRAVSAFMTYGDGRLYQVVVVDGFANLANIAGNVGYPGGAPYSIDNTAWGGGAADPIYYYGPAGARTYCVFFPAANGQVTYPQLGLSVCGGVATRTKVVYAPVDESSYQRTTTVDPAPATLYTESIAGSSTTEAVSGPVPYADRLTSFQTAQPATATVTDEVRTSLNGTIASYQQNDFCETPGELRTAALEMLRELAAIVVDFDAPIDWRIEEGHTIKLAIPEVAGSSKSLIVWAADATIDGASGQASQHFTCRFYPPELAA